VAFNYPKVEQKKEYEKQLELQKNGDGDADVYKAAKTKYNDISGALNFKVANTQVNVGMAQLINSHKQNQEDRMLTAPLPGFADLNNTQRQTVLLNTPKILQKLIEQSGLGNFCGSTLCSTIIVGNTIYNLNLGDSTAHLCQLSAQNTKVQQLNDIIILSRSNKIYIRSEDGKLQNLGVKNALGDISFEVDMDGKEGVTHNPDLKVHTIPVVPGEEAFIIVACDGLLETIQRINSNNKNADIKSLSEDWLKEKIQAHHGKSLVDFAAELANAAVTGNTIIDQDNETQDKNSQDNISVLVTKLDANETSAKYLAVFDGHGGDEVADLIYQLYDCVLQNQILLTKLADHLSDAELAKDVCHKIETIISYLVIDRKVDQVKQIYEDYNAYITGFINDKPALGATDFIPASASLIRMLNLQAVPGKLAQAAHDLYFKDSTLDFLRIPIYIITNNSNTISASAESGLRQDISSSEMTTLTQTATRTDNEIEPFYAAASAALDIRSQYNAKMPSSFGKDFDGFKDPNKEVIQKIESGVQEIFQRYPTSNSIKCIAEIGQLLEETLKGKLSSSSFFGKNKIQDIIKTALQDVSNNLNKANATTQKMEAKM
jgi:serine/threonine protein phosphatase PrpC